MALMKLQAAQKPEELHLWGKITGMRNSSINHNCLGLYADYYIAVAYTYTGMYEFPVKKFYWALSKDFEFTELPELNDQHKAAVNNANAYFEGNPKKKLVSVKKGEGEEGGEGGEPKAEEGAGEGGEGAAKAQENLSDLSEEEEIKIPPKDLTELDRLTFVVYAIENDCSIAPVGAFKMTPTHQVRRNEAFRGLQGVEAGQLHSYLHFRNV
jgi:radial spoke head protein 9